jgi:hypothetical protein
MTTTTTLIDPDPQYRGSAHYILPFGRTYGKWAPRRPAEHPFGPSWLAGGSAILVQRLDEPRSYPTRVIHSSGGIGDDWRIGNSWDLYHDQTDAHLGRYQVVGVVQYDERGSVARIEGNVPDRALYMSTFK